MTVLAHKKPCSECPFRREAAPGWLGVSNTDEFVNLTVLFEEHMPCHSTIDYEKKDWKKKQLPIAPHCAGSLIFLKNQCKMPRDPELAAMVAAVEKDTVKVFCWPHEFREHHNKFNTKDKDHDNEKQVD